MVAPTAFQEERVDGHGTPQEVLTIMSIQSMTTPDSLPHWDGFQEDYLSRIQERFPKLPQFLENPLSATATHYAECFAASSDSSAAQSLLQYLGGPKTTPENELASKNET